MMISLFPLSLPDELHASQASRYHWGSGNISARYSYLEMFDSAPFRLTYWIPQYLERFALNQPGSAISNLEALLRKNTLFPLFETYRNAQLNLMDGAMPISEQISNMPKRIVCESGETHLCKDCLVSDLEEFGLPYIHRSHQIPGVKFCWRHGCRLISSCPNCACPFERSNEFVLAPWESCDACGFNLVDASFYTPKSEAGDQELSYASFARDMLLSPTKNLSPEKLAFIYKSKLLEMGFSRKSQIDRKAITAALEEHFGTDMLSQIDAAYRHNRNQNWFCLCSTSSVLEAPLPRHLMLTYFLFGSASKFWKFATQASFDNLAEAATTDTCSSPDIRLNRIEVHPPSKQQIILHELASEDDLRRNRIEKTLRDNPGWTEAELWKTYPGLMKALLQHHDDGFIWLKALIESIRNSGAQGNTPQVTKQHPEDKEWAKTFAKTAVDLYSSTDKPMKISRNSLMRTAGWKLTNMPSPERFPLARQQLDSLCESDWHFYARRLLWAKLRAGATGASERSVLGASGIEHHQGLLVLNFFSSVPSNRPLRPGTIMDILKEHKVPKDWEGPAHDQIFLRPGRNSTHGGQLSR